jgi:membrane protease YdiL (CAAX protease family)
LAAEAQHFALSATGLMASATVAAVVLLAVAGVSARLRGPDIAEQLRLRSSRASGVGFLAAVTGMAGLSVACGALNEVLGDKSSVVMSTLARALAAPSPARFIWAMGAVAIVPGIAEETFFRGLVQTRLAQRWGRWPGIIGSAAAFGLFHVEPLQGSFALVAGLFLGWASDRLGGVRPTVLSHAANNALFVAFAAFANASETSSRWLTRGLIAAGVLVCIGSVAVLRRPVALVRPGPLSEQQRDP